MDVAMMRQLGVGVRDGMRDWFSEIPIGSEWNPVRSLLPCSGYIVISKSLARRLLSTTSKIVRTGFVRPAAPGSERGWCSSNDATLNPEDNP